jgi:cytoskeletal protein CcmA (bactofilin family)
MTSIDVNDVLKRTQSTANGSTTDFSFSFQVNNTNEIKVYEDSTLKTEGTHYDIVDSSASAGLNANGTGVVKFKTSPTDYTPANNKVITILSVMSIARASVYTSGGNLTASALEADYDRIHRILGDFREVKSRTLIAPEYSPTDIDMTMPSKASRLGKILGFNSSTGNPEMFTYLTNENTTALDGLTAGTVLASKYVLVDANKDITGFRNITLSGELDAGSLDVSGDADIDGTLEADAITVDGTALNEFIADTVGAMVGSNTETGISVTYEDGDNTLDFVIGSTSITSGMLAGSIADSKLSTITTAGKVSIGALEIDGASDIGADLADADLIIVDDGAGGTEVKSELTRVKKYIYSSLSGDASASDSGVLTIANDAIESTMLNDNIISGQTAITSGLASTDELLFSDAGTIKRMDVSVLTDYYKSLEVTETNKTLTSPVLDTGVSGTAIKDEDDMTSDSATHLATQQSIKAYVDAQKADMQFVLEDGDGTEVQITKDKEVKFVEGGGLDINWTDTSTGSDADPYDLTFTINASQTGITSLLATDIKIGEDDQTKIDFETADTINFYAGNEKQLILTDGALTPGSNAILDLGSSSLQFKDGYFDGTVEADAITIGGTTLAETISDTVGAMVGGNTETGITVTYEDSNNTLDFVIGAGSIVNSMLADDAVGADELASNAVVTASIVADAVTGAKIADDQINSEHYVDGSIDTAHIADLQVTTAKIAGDAITGAKIADNAINSEHYTDGSIDTAHIANDQITNALMADDAIGADQLASNAVVTASIVDDNVTQAKIADDAVGADQLASSAVVTASIVDNAVTLAKMAGLTRGSLITGDSSGNPSALAIGTNGQFLKSDGNDLVFGSATISGLAVDDLTVGDDAVSIATSSGNITIDAQANNSDIIFKGTDATADITMLTLDGSEAGDATFNRKVIATELDISGDIDVDGTANLDIVDIDGAVDMASTLTVSGDITVDTTTLKVDTSNNRVGVGTASPSDPLHVKGFAQIESNSGDANYIRFDNTANTNGKIHRIGDGVLSHGTFSIYNQTDNNFPFNIDANGHVTMPLQPAFLVKPATGQNNIALNTGVTVVLGTEIFDNNGDFASNTFTAPVTGSYQLNMNVGLSQLDSGHSFAGANIITSNRNYLFTIDTNTHNADHVENPFHCSYSVLADMDAGDTAHLTVQCQGGTQQTDIYTGSFFSGYLVA